MRIRNKPFDGHTQTTLHILTSLEQDFSLFHPMVNPSILFLDSQKGRKDISPSSASYCFI